MIFRTSLIGLLVLCAIGTAVAEPAGPPAGYKIDPEFTRTSPDGVITIEQYLNKDTEDYKWQFWLRREGTFTLLDPEPADYPAGFRFTYDYALTREGLRLRLVSRAASYIGDRGGPIGGAQKPEIAEGILSRVK